MPDRIAELLADNTRMHNARVEAETEARAARTTLKTVERERDAQAEVLASTKADLAQTQAALVELAQGCYDLVCGVGRGKPLDRYYVIDLVKNVVRERDEARAALENARAALETTRDDLRVLKRRIG